MASSHLVRPLWEYQSSPNPWEFRKLDVLPPPSYFEWHWHWPNKNPAWWWWSHELVYTTKIDTRLGHRVLATICACWDKTKGTAVDKSALDLSISRCASRFFHYWSDTLPVCLIPVMSLNWVEEETGSNTCFKIPGSSDICLPVWCGATTPADLILASVSC